MRACGAVAVGAEAHASDCDGPATVAKLRGRGATERREHLRRWLALKDLSGRGNCSRHDGDGDGVVGVHEPRGLPAGDDVVCMSPGVSPSRDEDVVPEVD
jgi:hypothetical protein